MEARINYRWQDTIKGQAHQVFGLFDGEHLIGVTAAFTSPEDPSGKTAVLAMSFIPPEYRGRGLSRLFYEARLDWIRTHSHFRRVTVSHRWSNEVSRHAIRRYDFGLRAGLLERGPMGSAKMRSVTNCRFQIS
jgi:RimJ/RimL family protein N-acetyltransferase